MVHISGISSLWGASPIAVKELSGLEKNAPDVIVFALPLVVIFVLAELVYSVWHDRKIYDAKETLGSILIGIGNLLVNLLMKASLLAAAVWIYNILPWRMSLHWWTLIPCVIIYDFCSYWSHRISHFNRFFWATHVVHYSAEHYNLTLSFRQSWVQHFKTLFFLPVAFFGFHPLVFFMANQISTLYQFWVHTESIKRLPLFLETWFGTPSNHRVHHGSQEQYLDKNFGAILMIWDHLSGTFEKEEESPEYGITTGVSSKIDPLYLNFHEYGDMIRDVRQAKGIRRKLHFIFASPAKIAMEKKTASAKPVSAPKTAPPGTAVLYKYALIFIALNLAVAAGAMASGLKDSMDGSPRLPVPGIKNMLFYLQRDPDANTIVYELNLKNGQPDREEPVIAYWIRYSEDGQKKDLSMIQRKFAYGIRGKQLDNDNFSLQLVSCKDYPLYLKRRSPDKPYSVYGMISGKEAILTRVFVRVNGGSFWKPNVVYIELAGKNPETGEALVQRIYR